MEKRQKVDAEVQETAYNFLQEMAKRNVQLDYCHLPVKTGEQKGKLKYHVKPAQASISQIFYSYLLGDGTKVPVNIKMFLVTKNRQEYIEGLLYEASVYDFLSQNEVSKYSPNFIDFLGIGKCELSKVKNYFTQEEYQKILEEFRRHYDQNEVRDDTMVVILMTENASNGKKFGQKDGQVRSMYDFRKNYSPSVEEMRLILFQIIYSISLMTHYRLVHNDMHQENILIVTFEEPVKLCYEIPVFDGGSKKFLISTRHVVYLFDWDMSFCQYVGHNPRIRYNFIHGMYNIFNPYQDIVRVSNDVNFMLSTLKVFYSRENTTINQLMSTRFKVPVTPEEYSRYQQQPVIYSDHNVKVRALKPEFLNTIPILKDMKLVYALMHGMRENDQLYLVFFRSQHAPSLPAWSENIILPATIFSSDQFDAYKVSDFPQDSYKYSLVKMPATVYVPKSSSIAISYIPLPGEHKEKPPETPHGNLQTRAGPPPAIAGVAPQPIKPLYYAKPDTSHQDFLEQAKRILEQSKK